MADVSTPTRSRWVRLPLLTFRDLRFLTIAAVITLATFGSVTDPDLWWHLKTGQLIVDDSRILTSDPFSWTAYGRTWHLHEWLSEVLIYWIQSNVSFVVAVALTAATITATLAIVYRLALRICSREMLVFGLVLVSSAMMLEFTKVRPQVFTWLFFAIFVRQLYLNYRGERVSLWLLPILMIFWSNMHLGYLFGLGMMYLWLLCTILRDYRTDMASLRTPLALTALTSLAPMVSPLGPGALLVPLDYLTSNRAAFGSIQEWASPNFHIITMAPMIIAIGLLLMTGLPTSRKQLFGLALVLMVLTAALVSRRNIPLFAIMFPIVAAESIELRWPARVRASRIGSQPANWAFATTLAIVTFSGLAIFGRQLHSEPNVSAGLPTEGVAYVREHQLGTRMLNTYNWGGYLISTLYPEVKVSIDGRSDLYGDHILDQYLGLVSLDPNWRDELSQLDPDFILIPKNSPLAVELRHETTWKMAFEGRVEMIFVPSQSRS